MVSGRTSSKKRSSVAKPFSTIAVAKIHYGPYRTKQIAEAALAQVMQVPRAQTSAITRTSKGFGFSATVMYGLKTASQKATALATIKKYAPSAKITFRKA